MFLISITGSIAGCLLTPPDEEAVLKQFYRQTRPWGFWGPIRDKVMAEDPAFRPNRDLGRDALNVLVGIVWQMALVVFPIYLVLKNWTALGISLMVLIATFWFLKINWYDKLED